MSHAVLVVFYEILGLGAAGTADLGSGAMQEAYNVGSAVAGHWLRENMLQCSFTVSSAVHNPPFLQSDLLYHPSEETSSVLTAWSSGFVARLGLLEIHLNAVSGISPTVVWEASQSGSLSN
jgi:hypothetical protein